MNNNQIKNRKLKSPPLYIKEWDNGHNIKIDIEQFAGYINNELKLTYISVYEMLNLTYPLGPDYLIGTTDYHLDITKKTLKLISDHYPRVETSR